MRNLRSFTLALCLFLLHSPPSVNAQLPTNVDSLHHLVSIAKADTAKVWLLNDLGRIYALRNLDSSNLLFKQAIQLSDSLHFYRGKVASLLRLDNGVNLSGARKVGEGYAMEALQVALEHDVKDWLGRSYAQVGDNYYWGMKTDSALHYFTLSETANSANGTEYFNWYVFLQKAQLFADQHQVEKAEQYYRKALDMTAQPKDRKDHGMVLYVMLGWYWDTQQWTRYAALSEDYLKFKAAGGNQGKRKDAMHSLLYFFEDGASPAQNIAVLKTIVQQHETLGNQLSLANALTTLGDFYLETGDFTNALASQKKAAELNTTLGYMDLAVECIQKVYETYEAKKDYANANIYLKRYYTLSDSLNSISTQKNMQELEVKYQTGKMEAEITQQQLVLEKEALARRSWTLIAIALLLAGVGIAFFLREKRRRAELSLRLEKAEAGRLRELDTVKSAFFANISHEFRTPLTLLLGPLREMEDGSFRGDAHKYFGIMRRNAARLLTLVNQLLDLSRLESGKLQLNAQPGDLYRTLRTVAGSFESLADQKKIDFQVHVPEGSCWAKFDGDKFEKIVGNLLSNAFKFTPEEGRVELEIGMRNEVSGMKDGAGSFLIPHPSSHVVISVSDNGIGIPPDQLPHIFERFYQVENTGADIQPGSGIGLALTKELVELHGGQISVESSISPSGTGTTFTVSFDFEKAENSPESAVHSPQSVFGEVAFQSEIVNRQSLIVNQKPPSSQLPIILVAEDNPDVRSYILEQLQGDYQLIEARDGRQALELALAQTPDLILTDLMMPGLNGVELTRSLKADLRTNHIPVVMLTAKGDRTNRIGGIETGAEAYLTKPFDSTELRATLNNLLAQRRILQEKFAKQIRLNAPAEAVVSLDEQFLQSVLQSIENNLDDETFGVEQLAAAVAMSRSNLFRKVDALLGKSPNQLIRERRLLKAKHLLENGAGNSTEVAFMTGFQSPSYFAKCYQEMFGEAPGAVARRRT